MRKYRAHLLLKEITALKQALALHQARCKHPERHRTHRFRSHAGNYDPTQDCYWTEYHCELCLKDWTVDSQRNAVGRKVK